MKVVADEYYLLFTTCYINFFVFFLFLRFLCLVIFDLPNYYNIRKRSGFPVEMFIQSRFLKQSLAKI